MNSLLPYQQIFHGPLIGKGRPRVTKQGHVYTPPKTRDAERSLHAAMKLSTKGFPAADCPLSVQITFSGDRGLQDIDNLAKLVLDAGNGAIWKDDRCIVSLAAHWKYAVDPSIALSVTKSNNQGKESNA